MNVTLTEPHEAQITVLNEAKRFNVLNCGRRWGKSLLAENLLAEPALDGHPVGYFTPTYKLLTEMWKNLLHRLHDAIEHKSVQEKYIKLITGGSIEFWTMDDPNAGRSRKYKRVILDEAAMARHLEEVWLQAVRPTLTDLKGDAWFMSTPKGRNYFHALYHRHMSERDWMSWTMPTVSNPYIDPKEILEAKKDLPDIIFKQEYEAEFAQDEMNPFGYGYLDAIAQKQLTNKQPKYFGIDIAFKQDWTVIIGLDEDFKMCYFDRFQKPLPVTQEIIKKTIGDNFAVMDATGMGQTMYQELRQHCLQIRGLQYTGGQGENSKYRLIMTLINAVQNGDLGILEGVVMNEMRNFTYIYSSNGNLKFEAPTGLHDDCVNALALAVKCREFAPVYAPIVIGDKIINP